MKFEEWIWQIKTRWGLPWYPGKRWINGYFSLWNEINADDMALLEDEGVIEDK